MANTLDARWFALWPDAPQQTAAAFLADMRSHYEANGRFYHTLAHIERMLDQVEALAQYADDMRAVRLAVWLHDVIYDFEAKDNEAQSAAYARRVLAALGEPTIRIEQVAALILATQHEEAKTVADGDTAVVRDADLATLAAPWPEYARYARQIRREFAAFSDEEYLQGRLTMLQNFTMRDPLFFTPALVPVTGQARANMRREQDLLRAGTLP